MIRRLVSACVGAMLVGALAHAIAKPPDLPEDGTFTATPATSPPASNVEVLPMPHEDADVTCPYLRQQMIDRHAYQIADPEMGRDVLENLERLKQADNLLEVAKDLARGGFFIEAMECCARAADLCPGSPCAERAAKTMLELAFGIVTPTSASEEAAEPEPDEPTGSDDVNARILEILNQSEDLKQIEKAWESIWSDGASEESEPPTCPYCGKTGKPIREIVPDAGKTKP